MYLCYIPTLCSMITSVVKKVIMSLSGLFLILFLTVHLTANFTILWGEEIFTAVTDFMGNNPVIKMIVPVLAAGFIIHIFYAFYLSLKNLKARGEVKYKSANRTEGLWIDHWASRNMLILGIIILGVLGIHLSHFWVNMQWQDFMGREPQNGYLLVTRELGTPWIAACYLIWFAALWLHINHGFWSAFHSIGLSTSKILPVLRVISLAYSSILCLGFTVVVIYCLFF